MRLFYHFVISCVVLLYGNVAASEKPVVFVSILPQKYFVEKIAGDLVDVEVMVSPGASPATYEPKPSQMEQLGKAEIYFAIGVPFEAAWLPRLHSANPKLKVVATDQGISKRTIETHHHDCPPDHHHHHHEIHDPHIWLSPLLVAQQAETIAKALKKILPSRQSTLEANLTAFNREIDALHIELKNIISKASKKKFMVFHPSWGYFADDYGLQQVAIESGGKSPSPSDIAKLVEEARKEGITTLFVQPQFSKKSASLIAKEIGGRVDKANPLAENWADNLRAIAGKLAGTSE